MIDELRQVAIFAAVAEHGSFRGAATVLGLSPSVVSHHISQLEQKLGVALLYRSTRRLALTGEGETLRASAQAMLAAMEDGLDAIRAQSDAPSGALRITLPAALDGSRLLGDIAGFARTYPKVRLEVDFSDDRKNLIRDGYDLAIRMGPRRAVGAASRRLFTVRLRIVASAAHLRARDPIRRPSDLERCDWVELIPARAVRTLLRKPGAAEVQVTPRGAVGANGLRAVFRLMEAGAGLALMPDYLVAEGLAAGRLSAVLPDWEVEPLDVVAEWPEGAAARSLPRLLAAHLRDAAATERSATDRPSG